ncbi:MAG: hypothetical protein NUV93_05790, partial [Firmicutes bacterium]|nr:hypothetical protein [Bacillota bacterium]
IQVETFNWHAVIPVPVSIDTGNVTGPSAGLMLSLEIIEQLNRGASLAGGMRVAGTGTIAPGGDVGPVGGVTQKVVAAERAGMQVFFTPRENAGEATAAARKIRIVPVSSLEEAVDYLLRAGGTLNRPVP